MLFHVGPYEYRLILANHSIFSEDASELEGLAVEDQRLLILSPTVEMSRRKEVALHELFHAWSFHIPQARTEEESAQLSPMISQQFEMDLAAAGGESAFDELVPCEIPDLRAKEFAARIFKPVTRDPFAPPDRYHCATCDAITLAGSIHTGAAIVHQGTGRTRVERWFQCEVCDSVQTWFEFATTDGTPTGEYVSNPKPQILRGISASAWLAEHALQVQ